MNDTPEKAGKPLGEFLLDAGKRIVEIERERNEARLRVLELEATAAAWQEERDNICAALGEHPESPLDIPERIRQIRDEGRAWMHCDAQSRQALIDVVIRLTAELNREREDSERLAAALQEVCRDYKELAESGDAGFWRFEDEDCAKQAQAALAAHESLRNQTK